MGLVTLWYRKDKGEGGQSLNLLFGSAAQCVCDYGTPLPKIWGAGLSEIAFLTFVSPIPIIELLYRKDLHCVVYFANIDTWQQIVVIPPRDTRISLEGIRS